VLPTQVAGLGSRFALLQNPDDLFFVKPAVTTGVRAATATAGTSKRRTFYGPRMTAANCATHYLSMPEFVDVEKRSESLNGHAILPMSDRLARNAQTTHLPRIVGSGRIVAHRRIEP
jgi:hypothetical protein